MKTTPSIKPKLSINAFGKERFFLGLSISIFSTTIVFYFLLYLREIFKLFPNAFSFPSRIWEIDATNMLTHDFILAMLACQIGQMIFFEFCFSKPSLLPHWNFRRKTVLLDNRNLILNFLFFGLQTALAISLFLWSEMLNLLTINGIVFWVLILTIIVIHLQAWTTINKTFKKANHWMLMTFGTMLLCATLMIHIHPLDYNKINQQQLNRVPDYQLTIQLPTSEVESLYPKFSFRHIAFSLQYKNGTAYLADKYKVIDWEDVPNIIQKTEDGVSPSFHAQIFASLTIDKKVPIELVFKLKHYLRSNGINKISYTLFPPNFKHKQLYPFDRSYGLMDKTNLICDKNGLKESLSFLKRTKTLEIFNYDIGCHPFSFMWEGIAHALQDKTTVNLNKKGKVYIENKPVESTDLVNQFYSLFLNKKSVELYLLIDEQAKFEDYIYLKATIWKAQKTLLNQACQQKYGVPYSEDLPIAYKKAVQLEHIIQVIEPNSQIELEIYQELERISKAAKND